jgi:hypothetical protein
MNLKKSLVLADDVPPVLTGFNNGSMIFEMHASENLESILEKK